MGIVQPAIGKRSITVQVSASSVHFNFSDTRTAASARSSSFCSEHTTRETAEHSPFEPILLQGIIFGLVLLFVEASKPQHTPAHSNSDLGSVPSLIWQDAHHWFSSQDNSYWLRRVSNLLSFSSVEPSRQAWKQTSPTASSMILLEKGTRVKYNREGDYVSYTSDNRHLPLASCFRPKFSELSLQTELSRIQHVVRLAGDSSFKNGRQSPVPHFNWILKSVNAFYTTHHLSGKGQTARNTDAEREGRRD